MPITPPTARLQAPTTIADTSGCTTANRPSNPAGSQPDDSAGDQPLGSCLAVIVIGAVGAILGTLIAQYLGVAVTPGIDWIEIVLQVAVAAVGVALADGAYRRRRVHR